MKKSETSPTFVIMCIAILIVAYGIGFCIQKLHANSIQAAENRALSKDIKNIESSPAYKGTTQEVIYSQNRRTRQTSNRTNTRNNNTLAAGRNNRMGMAREMQNFQGFNAADMQEQMQRMQQDMTDEQRQQMFGGGFNAFGEQAGMGVQGFGDPGMFGNGFNAFGDTAAMGVQGFAGQDMFGGGDFGNQEAMGAPVFEEEFANPQRSGNPDEFFPQEGF
ncbi:MAG: hypothetical protein JW787_09030 [Sedimentisphaerales bacterium]|nr:hypothetical protein [Sedimentisphaerales bacterium]